MSERPCAECGKVCKPCPDCDRCEKCCEEFNGFDAPSLAPAPAAPAPRAEEPEPKVLRFQDDDRQGFTLQVLRSHGDGDFHVSLVRDTDRWASASVRVCSFQGGGKHGDLYAALASLFKQAPAAPVAHPDRGTDHMTPGHDPVNHPTHYTSHPSGIECIQITEHMGFCLGNAVKYIWRADLKGGIEDLEKAAWYVAREIAKRKAALSAVPPTEGETP